ncbi:hypothetical protein V5799_000272 [Amblyomma americanum]|uniref:TLDc domain-containing protein n=1 Tax=Amblyomma americanum TaxID=6943 RepID=A0AAQ4D3I6_AMBAM
MPFDVDKFLKTAYNIQGVSAKVLNDQLLKSEAVVKSSASSRLRSATETGVTVSPSGSYLQVTSSCLSVKDNKFNAASRAMSPGIMPVSNFRSEVLSAQQMAVLWNWLPPRIAMLQPELVYSTNEHGSSLTNFYLRSESWEPTVLVVLTTREERFGAYCSTKWQERKQAYFGTGETFLFTFVPEPKRFAWVGVNSTQDVPHSCKLFLSANQRMIQIGAGYDIGELLRSYHKPGQ